MVVGMNCGSIDNVEFNDTRSMPVARFRVNKELSLSLNIEYEHPMCKYKLCKWSSWNRQDINYVAWLQRGCAVHFVGVPGDLIPTIRSTTSTVYIRLASPKMHIEQAGWHRNYRPRSIIVQTVPFRHPLLSPSISLQASNHRART